MPAAIDKGLLVSGSLQLFVCCVLGVFGDAAANYRAFLGAHHQFSHNAEVLLVFAVIAPHLPMSAGRRAVFNISAHVATWTNPLAYAIAGFAGTAWVGSGRDDESVSREWTTASYVSFAMVPVLCAPACFIAFGLLVASALDLPSAGSKAGEGEGEGGGEPGAEKGERVSAGAKKGE